MPNGNGIITVDEAKQIAQDGQATRVQLLVGMATVKVQLDVIAATQKDHENRIRSAELKLHWFSGVAAGVGALGGKLLSMFQ